MSESGSGRGRIIVLAAPSGAGKTSLVHELLHRVPNLKFSVSHTTRPRRETEVDGEDYQFVRQDEFRQMIDEGAFLEYAEVFGHWYGTSREHVETLLTAGHTVVLEIDWQGARQICEAVPAATSVFILPPSLAELDRRLRGRATDSEATIKRRLAEAFSDMTHWTEFNYVLINDDLEQAAAELAAIVHGRDDVHRTSARRVRERIEAIVSGGAGS